MNALRIERLVWSALFGLFVGVPVALVLAPDPTGRLAFAIAAVVFAVSVPVAFRLFEFSESPTARAGDMSARFATFLLVAVGMRVALDAVGFGGAVGTLASFVGGWFAADYASTRLNPRRWGEGGISP